MSRTKTAPATLKVCTALTIHALCPHCDSDIHTVPGPACLTQPDYFDNGYDGGRGAYMTTCDSCGERFAIPVAVTQDAQHACLVLLGEA